MNHIARVLVASLTMTAVGLLAGSCTPGGLPKSKQTQVVKMVKDHGLIIGFEGLQPFSGHRADDLTKKVAKQLDLAQAATSGNAAAYQGLVVEANANHQPIYIVGYSLGGNEARSLAAWCQKSGIPVDMLFLLDPGAMGVFTSKIPDNVHKVVFYASGTYDGTLTDKAPAEYLADPGKTLVEFDDVPDLNHLNLPAHVAQQIVAEIAEGSGRVGRH